MCDNDEITDILVGFFSEWLPYFYDIIICICILSECDVGRVAVVDRRNDGAFSG